jgi:hypothetical protein
MKLHDFNYRWHDEGGAEIDYEIQDADETNSALTYAGYMAPNSSWIITEITVTGAITNIRFAVGKSDYAANWTGRAGLSYGYLDAVFS